MSMQSEQVSCNSFSVSSDVMVELGVVTRMKDFEQRSRVERRVLVGYLYALSRDCHLAEDMAQETLLIAYRKREHYFAEADFGAWLRTTHPTGRATRFGSSRTLTTKFRMPASDVIVKADYRTK